MAIKYQSEYYDTENVLHEVEIYDDTYLDTVIEIDAAVTLQYAGTENPLECIRGKGVTITFEADTTQTFQELSTIKEREIKVIYKRGGVIQFVGWLSPGGWFEDFVSDKWNITMDCIDGLGYLDNLAFVDDATGLPYTGKKTMMETLCLALSRTRLSNNILTDIGIFYDGLAETENILVNTYVNMARYVEDDNVTAMSCDKVIRDILEPFTACITSKGEEWYIYRPLRLAENPTAIEMFRYDSDGVPLAPATQINDFSQSIGSYINGFYPHHAGANQRISYRPALGAYRINYKYGQLKSLLDNPDLCYDSPGDPIPGWNITPSIFLSYPLAGGCGVSLTLDSYGAQVLLLESDATTLGIAIELAYEIDLYLNRYPPGYDATFYYQIILEDGADTYYLRADMDWDLNIVRTLEVTKNTNQTVIVSGTMAPLPVAGDVKIRIYKAQGDITVPPGGGAWELSSFNLTNLTTSGSAGGVQEGEFHTFSRDNAPATDVGDVKEVYTGDNFEDNFEGALYESDQITNTALWNREGLTDEIPILGIMGTEVMRASQNPGKVFSGSVYGFFEYISLITIDGFDSLFIVTGYSYDTRENIISMQVSEIFTDALADLIYVVEPDYGKTYKPTIKG